MTNPLHAEHYADSCRYETVSVVLNEQIAARTYRLRFATEGMAERILPGQFLMLRLDGVNDPLIGRPLALYDRIDDEQGRPVALDVVYLVAGKLTSRLSRLQSGQQINVWGPLGNGFPPRSVDHLIMVAGGIGQTPFLALAKSELGVQQFGAVDRGLAPTAEKKKITFCYGARTASLHAGVEDFRRFGIEVRLATDDGSAGYHGLVTELLQRTLAEDSSGVSKHVVCCGPEPMMKAVAKLTATAGVSCDVSLEEPMACGVGICFTCVARIRPKNSTHDDAPWDYQRTCVEGPVYDARRVVWHE